jgi:hypothetical protein
MIEMVQTDVPFKQILSCNLPSPLSGSEMAASGGRYLWASDFSREGFRNSWLAVRKKSKTNCVKVEVKLSLLLNFGTGGSGGIAPLFLTLALEGSDLSASRPCRFTHGDRASGTQEAGWTPP